MFNIYVADSKTGNARLKDFTGLSLGEVKGFLSDLIIRDIRKGYLDCLNSAPQLKKLNSAANSMPAAAGLATGQIISVDALKKKASDVIYDEMSQHDLLSTVWALSDKTLIIVKTG